MLQFNQELLVHPWRPSVTLLYFLLIRRNHSWGGGCVHWKSTRYSGPSFSLGPYPIGFFPEQVSCPEVYALQILPGLKKNCLGLIYIIR